MMISAVCTTTTRFSPSRSTGKERDTESGNDYFSARYYSSAMGRFMSPDPIIMNDLRMINPQRWNKYAYVINNPLILTDPTGKDAAYVNFSGMAHGFGHAGVMSIHHDGSATFSYKDGDGRVARVPGVVTPATEVGCPRSGVPADRSSSVGWRCLAFGHLGEHEPQLGFR